MEYYSIFKTTVDEYIIERSKFITTLIPVSTIEDVENAFEVYKQSDATHNCYGYILRSGEMKSSDDGEPQGTAGAPIIEVLKKNELSDVLAIVTRYFGGVKLGASGLIGAYSTSVARAINKSKIVLYKKSKHFTLTVNFKENDSIKVLFEKLSGKIINVKYDENVLIEGAIELSKIDQFIQCTSEITRREIILKEMGTKYIQFDV